MRGTPFTERRKLTVCVTLTLGNDHWICSPLKPLVYHTRPVTADNLKESIWAVLRQVTSQASQHVRCMCSIVLTFQKPCVIYTGRAHRYPPNIQFYIFFQQIYVLDFLNMLRHSQIFSVQNAVYFTMLPFLVPVLLIFYIQSVLKFKCQIPVAKG
jgi:hypothetical protein